MNESVCVEELLSGLNMGMIAIDHLVDKIENERFKNIVLQQREHYEELKEKILKTCSSVQNEVKRKFMIETMIEMKTILSDDSKIAKMLIEGNNQAIMTMTHLMNKSEKVSIRVRSYENDFEEISQAFIEQLKEFL